MSGEPRLPETVQTIPESLAFWAEWTPHAPALGGIDGRELTHGALHAAVATIVRRSRELGIQQNDRVALVLPQGCDETIAVLGVMIAAIAVPFSPLSTAHELLRDLRRLPVRLMATSDSLLGEMRLLAAELGVPVMNISELRAFAVPGDKRGVLPRFEPEATAMILHTSGTTGVPKRIPRSHRALVLGSRAATTRTGLTADDVCLLAAGLHNISGLGNLLNALLSGGSCVVAPAFDPARFPDWLAECKPTWTFLPPTQLSVLLQTAPAAEPIGGPRSRLRIVRAGTQRLPSGAVERAERALGAIVLDTYGMSEAHSIAAAGPAAADRRAGSVGRPLAIEVRILDGSDADVAPGVHGEIVVRGPTVLSGYLDDPQANAAAFLPGGWFRTGDLGYLDADGFLFVTGRIKEQINRGGEQIAPAEIDDVLRAHPAVATAAVFAVPDARLGEDIVAAVVLRGGETTTPRALRAWMLDRLSPHKAPRRIWLVTNLPTTATGKVRREELAQRWQEQHK